MSKLRTLRSLYKKVEETEDHQNFYINRGEQNEALLIVLSAEERLRACTLEIKAGLFFLDPIFISSFCEIPNFIEFHADFSKAYDFGFLQKINEFLFELVNREKGGFSLFAKSVLNQLGGAYFLAHFDSGELQIGSYFGYRIA